MKSNRKQGPDERAQLKCDKSAAAMNVKCAKFVVRNSCKCDKNWNEP